MQRLLPILLLLPFIIACATKSITEGVVIDKKYVPSLDTVETRTMMNEEGDLVTVLDEVHYPEENWIIFEGYLGDGGELKTRKVKVSRKLYNKTSIGNYFRIGNQEPLK